MNKTTRKRNVVKQTRLLSFSLEVILDICQQGCVDVAEPYANVLLISLDVDRQFFIGIVSTVA